MKDRGFQLHDGKSGAAITVQVVPRSTSNQISEILKDGTVKVRLSAQSGEEQANGALLAFLAEVLQVKTEQLEIVAGLKGKDKLVTILDLDKALVDERILKRLS